MGWQGTTRRPSKDLPILTTTPTLVHVPLGCIPPSPIVPHLPHLPGPCMCVRGCVPLCLCLPLRGGRSCVVARDTHACVGHAQRHARPLVCPPRPLSSLPYLLTGEFCLSEGRSGRQSLRLGGWERATPADGPSCFLCGRRGHGGGPGGERTGLTDFRFVTIKGPRTQN